MRHVYSGPLGEVRNPCKVASKAAFDKAFPSHAGAASMVVGDFHPTTSNLGGTGEGLMSCSRHNLVPNGNTNLAEYRELHVRLSVAESREAATTHNTTLCTESTRFSDVVTVTPPIGTGHTCLMRIGTDWEFKFQLDQVNVSLRGPLADKPTSDSRRSELLPAAQAIASAGVTR